MRRVEAKLWNQQGKRFDTIVGFFHSFGVDFEELDNGVGNVSVAIVELQDGTLVTPRADAVKFLEPYDPVWKAKVASVMKQCSYLDRLRESCAEATKEVQTWPDWARHLRE